LLHVEDLEAAAYTQDGDVAVYRGGNGGALGSVALGIGFFGFGTTPFSEEGGVDIGASHEKKAVNAVERGGGGLVGGNEDRFESGGAQSRGVRFGVAAFAVDGENFRHVKRVGR
jgi:hypothetical protein